MGFPMDERLVSAARVLPDYLGQHALLSASALALGVVLSLPLAVAAVGRPRLRWPLLAIASAIQTIPGLALLALFYPLLLALSALLKPLSISVFRPSGSCPRSSPSLSILCCILCCPS